MNSSGFAHLTISPRRGRRRRASLTLYGSPLRPSQAHVSADRQTDQPDPTTARRSSNQGYLAPDARRDADALDQAIARVQMEARRDPALSQSLSAIELDLVVESIVRDLWHESLIKTFVPVLALRQTRERIRTQEQES